MIDFPRWKVALTLGICILSVYFAVPSFIPKDNERLLSYFPETRINLGLDLRGGSYLLLEVNFNAYMKDQLDNLRNDIRTDFRGRKINGERIKYTGGLKISNQHVYIDLVDKSMNAEVIKILDDISSETDVEESDGIIKIGYNEVALKALRHNVLEQSIEIVRKRVDETGTREPDIQRQGDNRILLQVPGLEDPEHLKQLLGKTAKMSFHLVDMTMSYPDDGTKPVPPGSVRLPSNDNQENGRPIYYVIKKPVMISGDLLVNATTGFSSVDSQPVVNIRFNNLGAKKFADITKENVGKPFAIVLDNKILTAPRINEPILGGSAQISGRFTTREANDLAILLRAGALPAPLEVIEERTVGPSLGADSIEAGTNAIMLGFAMIMLFMFLAYGRFGFYADIALVMNLTIMLAVISIFGATLTLPGIAGIVLTMGMSVDANVLIFERIREESKIGRTPFAAVDSGFGQALRTIIDSNLTTLIAALILYSFGSGPVKGFAVTLSVGILASMFSAILLTRLMVVKWLKKNKPDRIPL